MRWAETLYSEKQKSDLDNQFQWRDKLSQHYITLQMKAGWEE